VGRSIIGAAATIIGTITERPDRRARPARQIAVKARPCG
jgi:hypothetical protein